MYRFTKASKEVSSSSGAAGRPGGSRLFMQGTREGDDDVRDLQAVYTKRHLSTEVTGSNHESQKVDKRPEVGRHSVTTRVLRKTTVLTRGVEVSATESMMKTGQMMVSDQPYEESKRTSSRHHHQVIKTKKAKVVSRIVHTIGLAPICYNNMFGRLVYHVPIYYDLSCRDGCFRF